MNQRKHMRVIAPGLATLAVWACSSSSEPGGSIGAAGGSSPTSHAGAVGTSAGSGQIAGAPASGGAGATSNAGGSQATTGGAGGNPSAAGGGAAGLVSSGGTGAAAGAGTAGTGAGGSAPVACPATVTIKPGDNNQMLMAGGVQRTYLVHAPPGYTGKTAVPVVFDFHGLSGTGAQQKALSRWDKVGDSEGFIMVYPDGIDNAWNAGLCCTDDKTIDDVGFVRAIITALQSDACIDPKRIYRLLQRRRHELQARV